MKLWEQQAAFAQDVALLIQYVHAQGMFCTLGEAWRTPEQAALYAKQGKGIKNSLHCKKMALDISLFVENVLNPEGIYLTHYDDYLPFGEYWESLNKHNRWGGFFPNLVDSNHFQRNEV